MNQNTSDIDRQIDALLWKYCEQFVLTKSHYGAKKTIEDAKQQLKALMAQSEATILAENNMDWEERLAKAELTALQEAVDSGYSGDDMGTYDYDLIAEYCLGRVKEIKYLQGENAA